MKLSPSFKQHLAKTSILSLLFCLTAGVGITQTAARTRAEVSPFSVAQVSTNNVRQQRLQVFFPRFPQASTNFTQVSPVMRSTTSTGVARFAMQQLIAGPTSAEQQQGLRPAVQLRGTSTCGSDFTLHIRDGVAQLQFCRSVASAGVGDDARARSAIEATLRQFSTVNSVRILTSNGNCFGDQSGENRCLAAR